MAGHGIYTNPASVRPLGALTGSVIVGVDAPPDIRERRMQRRSPDILARDTARAAVLLQHDENAMRGSVDITVQNHGEHERSAPDDFILIVRVVAEVSGAR